MKLRKSLFALGLSTALVLGMSTAAFASSTTPTPTPTYTDSPSITIQKNYKLKGQGTSPAETFYLIQTGSDVSEDSDATSAPDLQTITAGTGETLPTGKVVGSVSYAAGGATAAGTAQNFTINLPTYTDPGVYTYTLQEVNNSIAGVTYFGSEITLVVTVVNGANDGDLIRVATVHTENPAEPYYEGKTTANNKEDEFDNTYSAGSLEVKKIVTGNLGDKDKEFDVTVTFTAPSGKKVNEAITYTEDGTAKSIATSDWDSNKASVVIKLKHNETITFDNIPYDVTYTVVEDTKYEQEANGNYDAAAYNFSDTAKKIDSEKDTVDITNNKESDVDTGISLDSLPYILLLVAVAGAAVVFVVSRRRRFD